MHISHTSTDIIQTDRQTHRDRERYLLVRSQHSTTLPNVPSPSVRTTLSTADRQSADSQLTPRPTN